MFEYAPQWQMLPLMHSRISILGIYGAAVEVGLNMARHQVGLSSAQGDGDVPTRTLAGRFLLPSSRYLFIQISQRSFRVVDAAVDRRQCP